MIAYAVNYEETGGLEAQGPGNLPCPDTDNNGVGNLLGCNANTGSVGRLPWLDLGIGDLRDANNERFWYAVARDFAYIGGNRLNTSTVGSITTRAMDGDVVIDGMTNDAIVAVIIAPGSALTRDDGYVQNRNPATADLNLPNNYLDIATAANLPLSADDEDNIDFDNTKTNMNGFIQGPVFNGAGDLVVNDRIEVITYEDIMPLIHARVSREIEKALDAYAACNAGIYPLAADFKPDTGGPTYIPATDAGLIPVDAPQWLAGGCAVGELPDWVKDEEWHLQTYYHICPALLTV